MITQGNVIAIMRDAIFTVIFASMPMLIVAVVVGLVISIFQATTQINEQTLAFVPKIVAVMLSFLIFGTLIFSLIGGFVTRLFNELNSMMIG